MPQAPVEVDWSLAGKLREYEIEEARAMQLALLPEESLCADTFEVASRFRSTAAVGGDFFDYFRLSDARVGLFVGDVAGKGLPAALYAALAVGTLRGVHKTGQQPNMVLELMNRRVRTRALRGRYCAVQYAVYDPPTRELRYSNAGLPGPVLLSAHGGCELRNGGLPAGMFDGSKYSVHHVQLQPGDAVLFFTDGLTEAHNFEEEEFGSERLQEACALHRAGSATDLLAAIFTAVDEFAGGQPQYDDMTAAVLKLRT
jgi:sigma-B regulation protein RsbU (phosphoserine phosphatase)